MYLHISIDQFCAQAAHKIESDSKLVVSPLTKANSVPWSISKVIEGVKLSLHCFKAWKVTHTHREANAAAHQLARKASAVSDCNVWVEDISPCIVEKCSKMYPIWLMFQFKEKLSKFSYQKIYIYIYIYISNDSDVKTFLMILFVHD